MARLEALLLCDFAQVRQNLLFVSSAGITRVRHGGEFPARTSLYVATMVYIPPDEIEQIHELTVRIKYPEKAKKIAEVRVALRAGVDQAFGGEGLHMPAVIPLLPVEFAEPGQVEIQVAVDDEVAQDWCFWLLGAHD